MSEATKPPSHELVSAVADDVLEVASRAERGDARLKRVLRSHEDAEALGAKLAVNGVVRVYL